MTVGTEEGTAGGFDAATLQILWGRLISAVDEASAALVRTAFSSVVRESYDFACVVTDARGHLVAQATQSIPSFIGTLPRTVRWFQELYPADRLSPGDVFLGEVGNEKDYIATRVSYALDLMGPSLAVNSACSSALAAVAH